MNHGRVRELHEKQKILQDFLKRAKERGEIINKDDFVGGKKFLRDGRPRPAIKGFFKPKTEGEKKMEQKKTTKTVDGFFSKVNEIIGLAYNLASLYSEAKKKEKKTPDAVKTLTTGDEYKVKLEELKKKLSDFDAAGFNTIRKVAIERYLNGVISERGVLTLLDREAKKRYEAREKVQGRPLSPFAPAFKNALGELTKSEKEISGIYPTISHSMYLKIEGALKHKGKFRVAMELAACVPEKWRKPFETQTVVTPATPNPETSTQEVK